MNRSTLDKLKKNPHFKPSAKLQAEIDRTPVNDGEEQEVRAIGTLPIHPTDPQTITQSAKQPKR